MLEVGYEYGDDRILLWLPWLAKHVITKDSPLSNWLSPSGFMADADSCIAVVVSNTLFWCLAITKDHLESNSSYGSTEQDTLNLHARGTAQVA